MTKLTEKQMIRIAKRILTKDCHHGMRVGIINGTDEKGLPWKERAVFYNDGKNYLGETPLMMNAEPGDL